MSSVPFLLTVKCCSKKSEPAAAHVHKNSYMDIVKLIRIKLILDWIVGHILVDI